MTDAETNVMSDLRAKLQQAEQQRDAAHAALREYGRHKTGCAARKWPPGKFACTCGLDAALAASAPQKQPWTICDFCGKPVVGLTGKHGAHDLCGDGPRA